MSRAIPLPTTKKKFTKTPLYVKKWYNYLISHSQKAIMQQNNASFFPDRKKHSIDYDAIVKDVIAKRENPPFLGEYKGDLLRYTKKKGLQTTKRAILLTVSVVSACLIIAGLLMFFNYDTWDVKYFGIVTAIVTGIITISVVIYSVADLHVYQQIRDAIISYCAQD